MRLLPTTLALASVILAAPASASADGRMCMVVPEMSNLDARASVFDAPASLSHTLVDLDGDRPRQGQGVLWCQSADDPRCMPVQHDPQGTAELGDMPLRSGGPERADVADSSAKEVRFVDDQTQPTSGVRRRVDRPPRS